MLLTTNDKTKFEVLLKTKPFASKEWKKKNVERLLRVFGNSLSSDEGDPILIRLNKKILNAKFKKWYLKVLNMEKVRHLRWS